MIARDTLRYLFQNCQLVFPQVWVMSLRNPRSIDKFLTFEASNVSAGPKIMGIRKQ
jgi:hypothetical protein